MAPLLEQRASRLYPWYPAWCYCLIYLNKFPLNSLSFPPRAHCSIYLNSSKSSSGRLTFLPGHHCSISLQFKLPCKVSRHCSIYQAVQALPKLPEAESAWTSCLDWLNYVCTWGLIGPCMLTRASYWSFLCTLQSPMYVVPELRLIPELDAALYRSITYWWCRWLHHALFILSPPHWWSHNTSTCTWWTYPVSLCVSLGSIPPNKHSG